MPDYDLEPCKACGSVVVHRAINTERKGLCQRCWDDPLKRAAALFGEDPDSEPDGLPNVDNQVAWDRRHDRHPSPAPPLPEPPPLSASGPSQAARGMTGMYAMTEAQAVMLALLLPSWLLERAARKLLGWPV
jgi:hypothetical protein